MGCECMALMQLAQDNVQWLTSVFTVTILQAPQKAENSLTS